MPNPIMQSLKIKHHIIFWMVYTLIAIAVQASSHGWWLESAALEISSLPMMLALSYFNVLVLMPRYIINPRFFSRDKLIPYFGYTVLTVILAGFFQRLINYELFSWFFPEMTDSGVWVLSKFFQSALVVSFPLMIIILLAVVWKISQLQIHSKNLENETVQSELKYLRSQINPHFLFNTLNNLYGLSLDNSTKTRELILKLSDFLSFSLYENNKALIDLDKEIKLVKDFIDLEQSRFEDRLKIDMSITGDTSDIEIPSLILVHFVENALKHSLKDETEMSQVRITLKIVENELNFEVSNSKANIPVHPMKSGIGLKNIIKRLDLLYGDDYVLNIEDGQSIFTIELKINVG